MQCADIMTREVVTVSPTDSISAAAALMLRHRISGLPVVDGQGALVGMVTEGDLLKRSETGTEPQISTWRALWLGPARLAERYVQTHGRTVNQIMTHATVTASEQTSLSEVVALMESRNIRRIPVLRDGRLVGIISRADLLRALAQLLPAEHSPASSDASIRSAILQELKHSRWVPREMVSVQVADGTVKLSGIVTHQAERDALRVLAQNTPGVKQVVDELIWVEPYTGMTADT